MSANVRFTHDKHSQLVRVHFRGEPGDRFMTPLAAQVMRNQVQACRVVSTPRNRQKSHCKNGHQLAGKNVRLYIHKGTLHRTCYVCVIERNRRKKAA